MQLPVFVGVWTTIACEVSADVEGSTGSTDDSVVVELSVSIALPGDPISSSACPTFISNGCSVLHISTSFYKIHKTCTL